ncbi:trimethylamine methyltransferase family protein [Roseovarius sp. CAU 1744]|uniref:trimethylamine methyltransferase family protein n=1 Tax=Roseovarius sp. CAU 1744 TaxID=3140368 RepID=UPI00325A86CD
MSRRRGRNARKASSSPGEATARAIRRIPVYELLDGDALDRLEAQADWILSTIGIEFRDDPTALSLFKEAGAHVEGTRVRFDPGHARALCASAPSEFNLRGRNPAHTITLGGDNVVLMPGYGSPFVTDLGQGRRYGTLSDFRNFVKLAYLSPYLHHSGGTVCEPCDIPVNKRHLDMVFTHLRYSTKPFMGGVTSPQRAADSVEMARLVFGEAFMRENAVIQANINVNSPLVFDGVMSRALRVYAAANQCVAVSPAIFGGAMGPLGPAATAAQTLAEGMAGIALAQLVRPGCHCVLGSFHSAMNLRSGALAFGAPESHLATLAFAQLGRRLNVPIRPGGGQITAANTPDAQAMQDSTSAMWATLLAGANQVWHAAGWLEGGLTMSYEKFVMDLDHCGMMLKLLRGIDTGDESLGRDAYLDVPPGGNFLSTAHTLRHYAHANYLSDLPEAGPYETWVENGRLTAAERATGRWQAMLAGYEMPGMDTGTLEALHDYMARRKSEMPDEWY